MLNKVLKQWLEDLKVDGYPDTNFYKHEHIYSIGADEYYEISAIQEDTPFTFFLEIKDRVNINKLVVLQEKDRADYDIRFLDIQNYIEQEKALSLS